MNNNFYADYRIIRTSNISDFADQMYRSLVEDDWELFGDTFQWNEYICQQLVKYNE